MEGLVKVGEFCPNPGCECYGKVDGQNIIRYGKTRQGYQRYQCKGCQKTFNERQGTVFARRKTREADMLECLALLAEGVRISSISRSKGIKEDTILSFLREAAAHAEQVEAILLHDYAISRVEIDALWTYVGRKHKEKGAQ